ncbi:MAG: hypothetical protein SF069_03025 [Phycisphaerae bacterium]|nr:hypothetical protein [Phycisphaerae bacterium]
MANSEVKTTQNSSACEPQAATKAQAAVAAKNPLLQFSVLQLAQFGRFTVFVTARVCDLWTKRNGPDWQSYPLAALSEEERGWLAHVLGDLRLQFEIGPVAGGPIKADQLRVRMIARAIEQAAQRLAGMLHRDAAAIEPPWAKGRSASAECRVEANAECRMQNAEGATA